MASTDLEMSWKEQEVFFGLSNTVEIMAAIPVTSTSQTLCFTNGDKPADGTALLSTDLAINAAYLSTDGISNTTETVTTLPAATHLLLPNFYVTLLAQSPTFTVTPGMVAKVNDAPGNHTMVIAKGGKLDLDMSYGANTIVFEGLAFSDVEVYRSGGEVRFKLLDGGETIASLPITNIAQTMRFTDGDQALVYAVGTPKLGNAIITSDLTGPLFVAATVQDNSLILSYNEELNGAKLPFANAFLIEVDGKALVAGTDYVVTAVVGNNLQLMLSQAVGHSAVVSIGYTDPSENNDAHAIQDISGNDATTLNSMKIGNLTAIGSSPSTGQATTANLTSSGVNHIDALMVGEKWGDDLGQGVSLTYSFPSWINNTPTFMGPSDQDYSNVNEYDASTVFGFDTNQQAAAKLALAAWAGVANLTFTEIADTANSVGNIRFAFSSDVDEDPSNPAAWAYTPNSSYSNGGDVWVETSLATDSWDFGNGNMEVLIHEIGHVLGLKHPFEDPTLVAPNVDDRNHTVMSYTEPEKTIWYTWVDEGNGYSHTVGGYLERATPMVYDIAVIQYLYGANCNFSAGDTLYTFDPDHPVIKTIWDGAGTDTISATGFTLDCTISLLEGSYSSLRYDNTSPLHKQSTFDGTNDLGIAFNCLIENATGGSGNDILIGNAGNNILDGGPGLADTAIFTGQSNDYTIEVIDGGYRIKDNRSISDGVDTLFNIENLQFSDLLSVPIANYCSTHASGVSNNDSVVELVGITSSDSIVSF